MELNPNGTVKAASVSERKRIYVKRRENQTVKSRLSTLRTSNAVRIGEVVSFDNREWLKVKPQDFKGTAWIEVDLQPD